jgi:drug/metabolite transporter (DMT)-like permease
MRLDMTDSRADSKTPMLRPAVSPTIDSGQARPDPAPPPPLVGVIALLLIATAMGSNHVAGRMAFDHGTSVPLAVVTRAGVTALLMALLVRQAGLSLALPRVTLGGAAAAGLLMALQSLCLTSAVARMPVALALLVFNTFPIMLALLSWLSGGERPSRRALTAMPLALAGLSLALGGRPGAFAGQPGQDLIVGSLLALCASVCFGSVLLITTRWLPAVDGRVRTLVLTGVVAVVGLAAAPMAGGLVPPRDATGWYALAALTALYAAGLSSLFVVLPRLGAVNNAAVMNFEPIAALIGAWLVLDQAMGWLQLAGAALVILAIVRLSTGRR